MLPRVKIGGAACLVTGASRGIGRALALALAARGARVLGVARDAARLASLEREWTVVRGCGAGLLRTLAADLARPGEPERCVAAAVEAFGGLDLLVNNAAVLNAPAPLVEADLAEWRRVLETNVLALVATLRAALPHLEGRAGAALNVSSTWGRHGAARFAPYCASKFAVEGLSQSVSRDVARATVAAVNPGVVATDMLRATFGGDFAGATSPADCAEGFVRLIEGLDRSHNGHALSVG